MIVSTLFSSVGVALVLGAVLSMLGASLVWYYRAQQAFAQLLGALERVRRIAGELGAEHPLRRRLESALVGELSFEEITRLLSGEPSEAAARVLLRVREQIAWVERFASFSVHLGILGTVFALVWANPNGTSFRASLPTALGTTFWGLLGALCLSAIAGVCEGLLERARTHVRLALLEGLEHAPEGTETATSDGFGLED